MAGVCGTCQGSGTITVQVTGGPKGQEPPKTITCPACGGKG